MTSSAPKLGLALARLFEMQQRHERAIHYYSQVYTVSPQEYPDEWDDAFVALCRDIVEHKSEKAALDCVNEAQRRNPQSRMVSRWERQLMDNLGGLRFQKPVKIT